MTSNQVSSVLQAVDELQHLKDVRCLVEIAYEHLKRPLDEHEETIDRCLILLDQYLSAMNCHLEELEHHIRVIVD